MDNRSPILKFHEKVEIDPVTECWEWIGSRTGTNNLFSAYHGDKPHTAKMWIYERTVGPIGMSRFLVPMCKNKNCVNPDHMRIVSVREWRIEMRKIK